MDETRSLFDLASHSFLLGGQSLQIVENGIHNVARRAEIDERCARQLVDIRRRLSLNLLMRPGITHAVEPVRVLVTNLEQIV